MITTTQLQPNYFKSVDAAGMGHLFQISPEINNNASS